RNFGSFLIGEPRQRCGLCLCCMLWPAALLLCFCAAGLLAGRIGSGRRTKIKLSKLFFADAIEISATADEDFIAGQGHRGVSFILQLVSGEDFELGAFL